MIERYGAIQELPDAACQPERDLQYRILYDISRPPKREGEPSPGLTHIARTINLLEWGGVPADHLHLAGVIHAEATPAALTREAYRRKHNRVNPDADLIRQLTQHGVVIYVCGQSVLNQGYRQDDVNPEVAFALSSLTVLANYQLKGYALMPY